MHIPDGFLDTKIWAPMSVVAAGIVAYASKQVNKELGEKQIPLMGVMGAFVFAAQMINFPVAGGTSGHFLGGLLSAVLLGPWSAVLVMTANFIVQCLLFQDGGLTALGANIFNMGILGCLVGYAIYKAIANAIGGNKGLLIGTAVAAWCSVMLASAACAIEIALSGTIPFSLVFPAMMGVHTLIGLGEALISTVALSYVLKVREDIIFDVPKV